jgi:alpha-tubulin suppressor-like RCC1 family protein
MSNGGIQCWGSNYDGELGNGTIVESHVPVDVASASIFTAISAGDEHTCALVEGGGVRCWGANSYGQLGDGTTTKRVVPVDVVWP